MENVKIVEKLATVEAKLDSYGKEFHTRLSKVEDDRELLLRLTVLQEQQQLMNKQHQEQREKMTETFNNINLNLTKLNMSQEDMRDDVKGLINRVDDMEEDMRKEANKGKIALNDILIKYVTWWILIPTGIIGTWILVKLGLK